MTILTVGVNQEYATLAGAIAASQNGDVIDVQAGTYTNDFATITTDITIQGIGGMVDLVATVPPPNGEAILATNADVTIVHVAFSGAAVADANGAGIRYDSGTLTLIGDSFTGNQEGLLAAADPAGTIVIDSSEFADNGAGDGRSHNLYVGAIATLEIANSYFHDALGGNEVKSRAAATIITDTRIIDGPTQTAGGYDLDVPDGGIVTLEGDTIEKGKLEPNGTMIHFGGEATAYAGSALTVTDSVLVNDLAAHVPHVVTTDQSYGAVGPVLVQGSTIFNVPSASILNGPGTLAGDTLMTGSPSLDTSSPMLVPAIIDVAAPAAAIAAIDGVAINPFAGASFTVIEDAEVTVTLSGALSGTLAYAGTTVGLAVTDGGGTLAVTGAASAVMEALADGAFSYTAAARSSGDAIALSMSAPNQFLTLSAGQAAVATTSLTETVAAAACFRAGTAILTAQGERPIESIVPGDLVLTASGRTRRVCWVGRRHYSAALVATHRHLQPIRIRAGALGDDQPRRDLFVSARHGMFLDGVLVPAEALIDGAAIARYAADEDVSYHHLELETHDIILAEGAASESFCDCDNRWMFDDVAMSGEKPTGPAWQFCAPIVETGPRLAALRASLDLGPAAAPCVMLLADERRLMPEDGDGPNLVFRLDPVPRHLRLLSPHFVPAQAGLNADGRRLGIALHRIVLEADGLQVTLDPDCRLLGDGFHAAETDHRWTNGDAGLPVSLLAGRRGAATVTIAATDPHRVVANLVNASIRACQAAQPAGPFGGQPPIP